MKFRAQQGDCLSVRWCLSLVLRCGSSRPRQVFVRMLVSARLLFFCLCRCVELRFGSLHGCSTHPPCIGCGFNVAPRLYGMRPFRGRGARVVDALSASPFSWVWKIWSASCLVVPIVPLSWEISCELRAHCWLGGKICSCCRLFVKVMGFAWGDSFVRETKMCHFIDRVRQSRDRLSA